MATTYKLISSVTVGAGGAANIEFTSIPQTYTDLKLVLSTRTNASATEENCKITVNGSSANFSQRILYGTGSSAASTSRTDNLNTFLSVGSTATSNTFSNIEIYFPNYAGSTYKSFSIDDVSENNATAAIAQLHAYLWSNTAAITSFNFTPQIGTLFAQYSTAYLYGIKNS